MDVSCKSNFLPFACILRVFHNNQVLVVDADEVQSQRLY